MPFHLGVFLLIVDLVDVVVDLVNGELADVVDLNLEVVLLDVSDGLRTPLVYYLDDLEELLVVELFYVLGQLDLLVQRDLLEGGVETLGLGVAGFDLLLADPEGVVGWREVFLEGLFGDLLQFLGILEDETLVLVVLLAVVEDEVDVVDELYR